jgi:hypothetical protein
MGRLEGPEPQTQMRFSVGDPAPLFAASTHTTRAFQFGAAAGRLVVLSVLGEARREIFGALHAELQDLRAVLDDERCCFFGVSLDAGDFAPDGLREDLPGIRWFHDADGAVSRLYGALQDDADGLRRYQPFSLLLDHRLRVLASLPLGGEGLQQHLARLLATGFALPAPEAAAPAQHQAPALMVPRVFEPAFCEQLIRHYRETGSEESGFMRDQDGKTVGVYDHSTKRRRDCTIADESLRRQCMLRIHRRLVPEIRRAYQFEATRMERYIVACYEGEHGGHFRAHRDNTTRATAHRRFAVSINLNEGYEGGEIWFPEYGRQLFRPAPGEAVVFSCSMLHEATPVRSGTRFVFLPFLYDDAAAATRQETEQYLGGNINAPPGG